MLDDIQKALKGPLAPLARYRQFILYRLVRGKTNPGKMDKQPIHYQTGRLCNALAPENWCDADTAIAQCAALGVDGIGFVFTETDEFWFLDIDGAWNGSEWSPVARQLCEMFHGAAVEVSQSDKGLHVFGTGTVPPHGTRLPAQSLEFYTSQRFVALTGKNAIGNAASDFTNLMASFVAKWFPPTAGSPAIVENSAGAWTTEPVPEWRGPANDDELIQLAMKTESLSYQLATAFGDGSKASFAALWNADADTLGKAYPDGNSRPYDASRADMALCAHLAYFTGKNCARIELLARRSGLERDKWDREGSSSYLRTTILKAVANCHNVLGAKEASAPSADASLDWPPLQPLIAQAQSEPYPLDALPSTIRAAVEEVAAFVKAPLPLVASSALAALSLAGQAHVDVKRSEKLTGPVGLFLLTIADSGERKSTCDGFFTKPIHDYEKAQAEAAKPALKDHQAACAAWEAKHSGVKEKIRQFAKQGKATDSVESALHELQNAEPEAPRIPRLLYSDATPEALAYGLANQWPAGGVVSAEAGIVFGSHGMSKDSMMRNLALLNQLWDGASLTIDRRSTESFTVRGARLTVALQVQEPTLREFFNRSGTLARGTGFLARFLVAWPESTQGSRLFTDAPPYWPHLTIFHQRISAILNQNAPIDEEGILTPDMLTLTAEAKKAWVKFHNAIEVELASGGELYDVRDVASKSADNAVRLAALFHLFDDPGGAIGSETFEGASRIAAWHLNEARRFFGELALPPELAGAVRLDAWLIEYCKRERVNLVPIAKLLQRGPSILRSKVNADTALRELAEAGRARQVMDGKRKMIAVNPALLTERATF